MQKQPIEIKYINLSALGLLDGSDAREGVMIRWWWGSDRYRHTWSQIPEGFHEKKWTTWCASEIVEGFSPKKSRFAANLPPVFYNKYKYTFLIGTVVYMTCD